MRDVRARVPELDGLRGLAVVAVVAYHAWPSTVPGGWLGVSLFFTLSGYLITGILIRDHEPTAASMATFWGRRARRLLPAALVTIVAVLGATAAVDAASVRRVAGDALASILYVQNWREAAAPGGYEAIFDTGLRPLAHMWSLSIEEQVYVLLPLAVLWLGIRTTLVAGTVLAAAGTVVWWGSPDAYYATPVRFTEVLAGAALAWWLSQNRRVNVPALVPLVAGAVLAIGVTSLHESSPWVSKGALALAALCSVATIAGAVQRPVALLRLAPVVWLGHRSYAIYLIHWPLLVLTDLHPAAVVAATLLAAELSHHLLEGPIRSGRLIRTRVGPSFAAFSGAALVVAGFALLTGPVPASDADVAASTMLALEDPAPPPATEATAVQRSVDPATTSPEDEDPATTTAVPEDEDPATTSPEDEDSVAASADVGIAIASAPTVLMIGDSTAVAIEPAVQGWVSVAGGTYVSGAVNHCSPVFTEEEYPHWSTVLLGRPRREPCRVAVPDDADVVLLVDHGMPLFDHFDHRVEEWTDLSQPAFLATVRQMYAATIDEAAAAGAVVVIATPPTPELVFHTATEPARREAYLGLVADLAGEYDHVSVIEWGEAVDADPQRYPRGDGLHLDRETGAVHAVVDLLAPAFRSDD